MRVIREWFGRRWTRTDVTARLARDAYVSGVSDVLARSGFAEVTAGTFGGAVEWAEARADRYYGDPNAVARYLSWQPLPSPSSGRVGDRG